MAFSLDEFAGGLARGYETGSRMRMQRERDQRDRDESERRKKDWENKQEDRKREQGAWDELNEEIMRRTQGAQGAPSAGGPVGAQPGPIAGGQATTVPAVDPGAGLQPRELQPGEELPPSKWQTPPFIPQRDAERLGRMAGAGLEPRGSTPQAPASPTGEESGSQRVGFGIYQNPNLLRDPEFLNRAAQIFVKAKMPEGVKWLERGYKAQQENAVDALKALSAGDVERAVQSFNSAGRTKVEGATPITEGPDKGKWQVTFQGGQSRVIDPAQELKSFLDPKEYFAIADKERDDSRAQRRDESEAEYKRRMAGVAEQDARTKEAYRRDTAANQAEANRVRERGIERRGGAGQMNERDYNNLSAKVEAQLRRHMRDTAPSDPTGKKQNNPLSEFVPDIREDVMRDVKGGADPEVAFNNRYTEWADKFDKADQVLGQAFDKARKAGSGVFRGRKESVESLRSSLRELDAQGVSVEEARRFAQASKRDMGLFREAAAGLARGQITQGGPPGLGRRGASPAQSQGGGNGEQPPAGVPAGSRRIGTSGGKPVWQAPNGKKYIED